MFCRELDDATWGCVAEADRDAPDGGTTTGAGGDDGAGGDGAGGDGAGGDGAGGDGAGGDGAGGDGAGGSGPLDAGVDPDASVDDAPDTGSARDAGDVDGAAGTEDAALELPDASVPDAEAPDAAPPSPAGGPCEVDEDCAAGRCDDTLPDGLCRVSCNSVACTGVCPPLVYGGACSTPCDLEAERPCRDGWVCGQGACVPDCELADCPGGAECGGDGLCREPACVPEDEVCNGADDDCDGRADEGADCPRPPAAACDAGADCASGVCEDGDGFPDGFCVQVCADDGDCGAEGLCAGELGERRVCLDRCGACRAGWVCDGGVCLPDCEVVPCPLGLECNPDGFCESPELELGAVNLVQVVVRPLKANNTAWDGVGRVDADTVDAVLDALTGGDESLGELLDFLGGGVLADLDLPDPFGNAQLLVDGAVVQEIELAEQRNTLNPVWDVAFDPVELIRAGEARDVELRVTLSDADLVFSDAIGTVRVGADALITGIVEDGAIGFRVDGQGDGQIVFVVLDGTVE
jgi:hypothetical protein